MTQEGEDSDFFPLLTPLIETMKEGHIPSFKSPLRCAKREVFSLRTSLPAGAADPPCRECRLRPSPKGLGRAKRRGCGDCVLPSSAPGSGRPRSPAEMPFRGDNLSIWYNDRVDQRRGEVPSFVVSRMGSRGREIEIPSPGVLSLFVHFLFARAKRKWTPTRTKGHRSGQRDTGRSADEASGLTNPKRETIITSEKGELGIPG